MNINKHLILLFSVLFFLFAVSVSSGCFRKNESDVKSVVRNELDQLKNLDSETTQKYIPYTELFPDATENTDLTEEINETFSLFFRKFNYKISDVIVGTANHSATVSVKLTTIDSKVLARDFKAELLRTQITESAQAQKGNIKDSSRSLEAHYLILNHLLNTNDYDTDGAGQGGIFVHSVACGQANSYNLPAVEYNKLGSPASHGCIRTCVADAKWVYENCNGAPISIIDGKYKADDAMKGPLGKKALTPLRGAANFDPTDPAV